MELMSPQSDKYSQPYILRVVNNNDETTTAILFGGIFPCQQNPGVEVSSYIPDTSYQDLLIELFCQKTVIGKSMLQKVNGYNFWPEHNLSIKTWRATGSVAQLFFSFGEKEQTIDETPFTKLRIIKKSEFHDMWESKHKYEIDALTHISITIPPKSEYVFAIFPSSIKHVEHMNDVYHILSSEAFKKLLKAQLN